ncbi:MAG: hypothetical protein IKX75_07415 [Desulfovibrio sp.]|nr:hypothetical protein [Desulfovibrio sp.]
MNPLCKRLSLACACILAAAGLSPSLSLAGQADFGRLLAEKQELTFLFCGGDRQGGLDAACAEPDEESTLVCKDKTCVETAADWTFSYTWKAKDGGIELVAVTVVDVDYKGRTIVPHGTETPGLFMADQPGLEFPAEFGKLFEQTQRVTWYGCGGEDGKDCKDLNKSRSFTFAKDGTGRATGDEDMSYDFTWKPRAGGAVATSISRTPYRFDGRHLVRETEPYGFPGALFILKQAK